MWVRVPASEGVKMTPEGSEIEGHNRRDTLALVGIEVKDPAVRRRIGRVVLERGVYAFERKGLPQMPGS